MNETILNNYRISLHREKIKDQRKTQSLWQTNVVMQYVGTCIGQIFLMALVISVPNGTRRILTSGKHGLLFIFFNRKRE